MDFKEMMDRAVEIRGRFAEIEKERLGREWSNQEVLQGFVGDVGALAKLVMAKEGLREIEDVDEKLRHELADCLWSIMVLATRYKIDLGEAFRETMDELEKRSDLVKTSA